MNDHRVWWGLHFFPPGRRLQWLPILYPYNQQWALSDGLSLPVHHFVSDKSSSFCGRCPVKPLRLACISNMPLLFHVCRALNASNHVLNVPRGVFASMPSLLSLWARFPALFFFASCMTFSGSGHQHTFLCHWSILSFSQDFDEVQYRSPCTRMFWGPDISCIPVSARWLQRGLPCFFFPNFFFPLNVYYCASECKISAHKMLFVLLPSSRMIACAFATLEEQLSRS